MVSSEEVYYKLLENYGFDEWVQLHKLYSLRFHTPCEYTDSRAQLAYCSDGQKECYSPIWNEELLFIYPILNKLGHLKKL